MRVRVRRGFILAETLIALGLLMLCLLCGLAVHLAERRVVDRVEAQGQALGALEGALEELRAGALPLTSGELSRSADGRLTIVLEVSPTDVPALLAVRLEARYTVAGEE